MIYQSPYGKQYEITNIFVSNYRSNGNLAIELYSYDEEFECDEPFGSLTVNLIDYDLPENMAFVDTNNMYGAEKFIKDNKLGKFTGEYGYSGYCSYPLYKFNLDKLKKGVK